MMSDNINVKKEFIKKEHQSEHTIEQRNRVIEEQYNPDLAIERRNQEPKEGQETTEQPKKQEPNTEE